MRYAITSKGKACASGALSISPISAVKVCKALNRKKFVDAKKMMEDVVSEKASLKGKYFTKPSKEILKLLNQAENNARNKDLDVNALFLFISASKGPTMHRRRRKSGSRMKMCNVQVVLSDKNGFGKKIH